MKHSQFLFILIVFGFFIILTPIASAVTLSLVSSKTIVSPGESLSLDIVVDDATDVVGCTFTLLYPDNVLSLGATPISTSFSLFFPDNRPGADPPGIDPWIANIDTPGVVSLSGAYISLDSDVGGGGNYTGTQILFKIHFQVKNNAVPGLFTFELQQTMLCNGPMGWGIDYNNNGYCDPDDEGEGVPILVKAYPKGSPQWDSDSLADSFEVLLDSFPANPTTAFEIVEPSPEINLKQGDTDIQNGNGSHDFGAVTLGTSTTATFTIENTGNATLSVTSITFGGVNPGDFSSGTLPSSVAPGTSDTFDITLTPGVTGECTAEVSIANTDSDEDPYTFTVTGTGQAQASNSFILWTK